MVPLTETDTVAGSPVGTVLTPSTTAEVTQETESRRSLRPLNWARITTDCFSMPEIDKMGSWDMVGASWRLFRLAVRALTFDNGCF